MNAGNTTTSMTAGTLSAGTHTRYTAAPTGGYPANISHNATIATGTSATFTWVAPSVGTTVYLFSNALGVNNTGGTGGDKEVFKNLVLTPAATGVLTLSCSGNQTINSSTSTVVPNVATTATASTTCSGGVVTKTQSPAAGTPLTAGNNVITVTATDNCGNTQTCTSTINYVINTGVLTLSCSGNQTINSSTSTVVPNVATTATASTTCPGGVVTKTQSPAAGTPLTVGNNVITVTATDNCNNSHTCTTTINYVNNTGVLTLSCPGNQTINSSSSTVVPNLTTTATASTTCSGGVVTKTQSPAAGTPLTVGNNVITVTATDNCNNTQTCTSTINYINNNTGVLSLSCPVNQTINSTSSTVVPNIASTATASTTCSGGVVTKTQSPAAGTPLTSGNNVVTVTATDNCNNTQTCTSTINYVNNNTGVLALTCGGNQTILATQQTTVPNLTIAATASTSCPGGLVNVSQLPAAGSPLTVGNNMITITATDNCNNTQTCTSTINFVNNNAVLNLTCGANQVISTTQQPFVPNVTTSATATSTCSNPVITMAQSPAAGSTLALGLNTILITATDNCGNSQTCQMTINYTANASVEELAGSTELSIFPNPTNGELTVNYYLVNESSVVVDLTDLNGKVVLRLVDENAGSGNYSKHLSVSGTTKGIYFVKLQMNGKETFKKLIID